MSQDPLMDSLVGRVISMLPGQQGGFWHPPMDVLVVEAIHTPSPDSMGRSWGPLLEF